MSDVKLAPPIKVGQRKFHTKRAIREFQAAAAGLPEPPPLPDDDHWLSEKQAREILGGVSHMWMRRHGSRSIKNEAASGEAA